MNNYTIFQFICLLWIHSSSVRTQSNKQHTIVRLLLPCCVYIHNIILQLHVFFSLLHNVLLSYSFLFSFDILLTIYIYPHIHYIGCQWTHFICKSWKSTCNFFSSIFFFIFFDSLFLLLFIYVFAIQTRTQISLENVWKIK